MTHVAKALIYDKDSKVLVLKRSGTHPHYAHEADLPGGIAEVNETALDGLIREINEETGLVIAESQIKFAHKRMPEPDVVHEIYVVTIDQLQPAVNLSWEHESYEWVTAPKLDSNLETTDEYMLGVTEWLNMQMILKFLNTQKLSVVSTKHTQTAGLESALVAFVEDDELRLYFQTRSTTRKAANLQANPAVAVVIGFSAEELKTLQYEGIATQLIDSAELEAIKQKFIDKDSPAKQHLNHPDVIFFQIQPTWLSFSDYSAGKPRVLELTDL